MSAFFIALLVGCSSKVENYTNAYYSKIDEHYVITLKGSRHLMTHDLISALLGKTYEVTENFDVPRIAGVVDGREIPVTDGYYKYIGHIVFVGSQMKIDLYYDNDDNSSKERLSWNGDYVLLPESDRVKQASPAQASGGSPN